MARDRDAALYLAARRLPAALPAAVAVLCEMIAIVLCTLPALAQSGGRTVTVEAVTLAPTPLVESVSSVGNLVADESVVIRPEVDGRIVEIAFQEGQAVKSGQLLFRLDGAIFEAQMLEAEARLELDRRTYERARALNQRGHSTGESLDKTLTDVRMGEASVALNKARLDKMRITAPFSGIAGLRKVSLGAVVEAKTELVTVVNLDAMKVEFRLPERYYRVIAEGSLVRAMPDALPGEVYEGTIYAIAPAIDINGRSVAVKARLANKARRLRPGMFARVSLQVDRRNQALVVPEAAIVTRGDGQFVFRIVGGKAELAAVQLGLRQTGQVEIVDGLKPGDQVVTAGQIKLRPGTPVKVAAYGATPPQTE